MNPSSAPKKLVLIDGYAMVYRAYFAFIKNPRVNSKGENTSAAFGFTNLLNDLRKKLSPTHLAVVFDPAEDHGERAEIFPEYKAHREAMPEDLRSSLPHIVSILSALKIPLIQVEGFEADDVIGTLAVQAENQGFETYMVTSDKDYGQLVSEKRLWYRPGRMGSPDQILGPAEVCEKFQVDHPLKVIDLLGLMGDSADNIPGIPGVGEKTAVKLLAEYGTVEGVLAKQNDVSGKLGERIREHAGLALISKKLATIVLDVPLEWDESDLECKAPDAEELSRVFAELEFRNLAERMLGASSLPAQTASAPVQSTAKPQDLFSYQEAWDDSPVAIPTEVPVQLNTIESKPHQYFVVQDALWRADLLVELLQQSSVTIDTETTDIDPLKAELVGLVFSFRVGQAYYLPMPRDRAESLTLLADFDPLWKRSDIEWIGQNIKYDLLVLRNYDIHLSGRLFDTMLAHYLMEPELRHNLDFMARTYLGYETIPTEALLGPKGKQQKNMRDIPVERVADYACEDADITLQLALHFKPLLEKAGVQYLFDEVEMPLLPVLADMEWEGINIDSGRLAELSASFGQQIEFEDRTIQEMAGTNFNTASPKQLGEVLFDHLKLDAKAKKTRTGQYSTNEETLKKLEGKHPIIEHIFELRELQKLKGTYLDALPELRLPRTGRVHTNFNQAVAATGRLSSNNPNLQNIPNRTARGREIRTAFVPRSSDFRLVSADYSQVELRLIAELSGEEQMKEAFRQGQDIHAATAARIFSVALDEVDKTMRSKAKMVNFGIIYGISAFGLAQRLGIPRSEAAEIISAYVATYPGIREYMDSQVAFARNHGYVETLMGRRRYLRDITSANQTVRGFAERNAINAPIQGSAADIIKLAMIRIQHAIQTEGLQSRLVLQVHDELVFDTHLSELERIVELAKHHMPAAYPLSVPLEVEVGVGMNWLEAH